CAFAGSRAWSPCYAARNSSRVSVGDPAAPPGPRDPPRAAGVMGRAAALAGLHRVAAGPRRGGRRRLPHSRPGREDETPPDTSRPDSIGGTGGPCARGSGEAARSVLWSGDTAPRFGATARAALSSLRRARNTSKPARQAALSAARTMITIISK